MSWLYVPESAGHALDLNGQDAEQSVMSKMKDTQSKSSKPELGADNSTMPQSGTMLPHSTGDHGVDEWISSLPVFHASPSHLLENDKENKMNAIFGRISSVSFARLDQDAHYWKTYQDCFQWIEGEHLDEYLQTWPHGFLIVVEEGLKAFAYELQTLERHTNEKEFSSWPTPTAQDGKNATCPPSQATRDTLPGSMWRTPQVADVKSSKVQAGYTTNLTHQAKGNLNADWVESLMGYPQGWTDLTNGLQDLENPNIIGNLHELSSANNLIEQSA